MQLQKMCSSNFAYIRFSWLKLAMPVSKFPIAKKSFHVAGNGRIHTLNTINDRHFKKNVYKNSFFHCNTKLKNYNQTPWNLFLVTEFELHLNYMKKSVSFLESLSQ